MAKHRGAAPAVVTSVPEDAVAAVFARAAELDLRGAEGSPGVALDEEALVEIGASVGLRPDAVRQAVAEHRAGSLLPVVASPTTWVGPRLAVAERRITGDVRSLGRSLDRALERQWFRRVRDRDGRSVWAARTDLPARVGRRVDLRHRHVLAGVASLAVTVVGCDGGAMVRIEADPADHRNGHGWTVVAAGWGGATAFAVLGLVASVDPGIVLALPGAGAGVGAAVHLVRRSYGRQLARLAEDVEGILDRLGRPDRQLDAPRGRTVVTEPADVGAPTPPTSGPYRLRHLRIHGHDVGYRMAGSGPALVLIHGLTGSSTTWREVMPALAERFTVVAPDLLGHGESAKPRGDYSLGAFASGIRDLLVGLDIDRATIVGHSLGGGVALQLSYQFPERCERLVLVSSGGLGKEVHAILRAVTLPGSELVLPIVLAPQVQRAIGSVGELLGRLGIRSSVRSAELWRSYVGLTEIRGRTAFVHTVRSVIDASGQRVSARDRLYLAEDLPTLIVWGDRDRIIPVEHARTTHDLLPGSTLRIIEGAGHFVPFEAPAAFLEALVGFIDATEAAIPDEARFKALMLERTARDEAAALEA